LLNFLAKLIVNAKTPVLKYISKVRRGKVLVTVLMILDAVISIALIASVILQSGKSAGLSGSIAGGAETLFGGKKKGMDEMLSKATMVLGALFGVITMVLVRMMQ